MADSTYERSLDHELSVIDLKSIILAMQERSTWNMHMSNSTSYCFSDIEITAI